MKTIHRHNKRCIRTKVCGSKGVVKLHKLTEALIDFIIPLVNQIFIYGFITICASTFYITSTQPLLIASTTAWVRSVAFIFCKMLLT